MWAAIILWAIAGVLLIALVCCYNTVKLGIAVFKTTTNYVRANMLITLLPAISVVIAGLWFAVWLSAAVFIFSVGTPVAREDFPFVTEMKWDNATRGVFAYYVFALLWVNEYIYGCV